MFDESCATDCAVRVTFVRGLFWGTGREVFLFVDVECAMKIFLAGIMQGSHVSACVHDQSYRDSLHDIVQGHWPKAEVYDPFANHTESVGYSSGHARDVFCQHIRMCQQFDVLIAYVPEASMGTAIEMWEAHMNARFVITITPLIHNWVVQITSNVVYGTVPAFVESLRSGEIDKLIRHEQISHD